ncbi:hypothetical protein ENBRE01_0674 [Enteropsectra breve]|nr:hypothetical protein ENBRE01_0674 [Enteropsectra breve]
MEREKRHKKFERVLKATALQNFQKSVKFVCNIAKQPACRQDTICTANEANFQLPNVFLRTKENFKLETVFANNNEPVDWIDNVKELIDFINEIQFNAPPRERKFSKEKQDKILTALLEFQYK